MANRKIFGGKMAKLQAAEDTMAAAVAESIGALSPGPQHAATALLARKYAELIDQAEDLAAAMDEYGDRLFACLAALGATPPTTGGGANVQAPGSGLARLRQTRRPR
jgi:hypothetical protein